MGLIKSLIAVVIILLMIFAALWVYAEIKYSLEMKKEINDNNATCYFERGIFKIPVARICTYNKTIIIEKRV